LKNSRFTVATHILSILSFYYEMKPGFLVKSHWMADSVNTNPVIIRRILGKLREAGLVDIQGGASGGAKLTRSPKKISLKHVYKAIEDDKLFALHTNTPSVDCPVGLTIRPVISGVFDEVDNAVNSVLEEKSLDDLYQEMQTNYTEKYSRTFKELFKMES
jgi:DNA-binding IscR family transcriptional regulator